MKIWHNGKLYKVVPTHRYHPTLVKGQKPIRQSRPYEGKKGKRKR